MEKRRITSIFPSTFLYAYHNIIMLYVMIDGCSSTNRHVLIVDDDEDILTVTKRQLSRWYEVDTFSNAIEALEHIKDKKNKNGNNNKNIIIINNNNDNSNNDNNLNAYDVILSDIRMPVMDGFEFVRRVMPLLPNAKIIFMTPFEITKSEFNIVHPSIQIHGFISKPFSTEQLHKIIEKQFAVSKNS